MSRSTFVVVPTHNEEGVIRSTLESLLTYDYTIVVVDDGSKDHTWEIVSTYPVIALRHPVNLGQGAALQTGMLFALQQGAQVVVHFDADGQHAIGKGLVVKREPVLPVDAPFPDRLETLDLFDLQKGVPGIFGKQPKGFERFSLGVGRQNPKGALETLAAAEDHPSDSRSWSSSSMLVNSLKRPARRSSSASRSPRC